MGEPPEKVKLAHGVDLCGGGGGGGGRAFLKRNKNGQDPVEQDHHRGSGKVPEVNTARSRPSKNESWKESKGQTRRTRKMRLISTELEWSISLEGEEGNQKTIGARKKKILPIVIVTPVKVPCGARLRQTNLERQKNHVGVWGARGGNIMKGPNLAL